MQISMIYDDENRGKIQFRDRARQINDFSGLRYGNITPTDIDGFIEYHNNAMVFYEIKYGNKKVPYGQELSFMRLADNNQKAGTPSTVLVCRHNISDPEQDVNVAETIVSDIYYAGRWYEDGTRTAKQVTDSFLQFAEKKPF